MVKVSVVIPVYNVEEFLKECLDSIVNQTLEDIEIICVNDGSKDKSLDILNYYAENDDRFTVISQENGGHAVATNRGMKLAEGEFIRYIHLDYNDLEEKLIKKRNQYNRAIIVSESIFSLANEYCFVPYEYLPFIHSLA